MTHPPVACSLTGPEIRRRIAETGELAREALRDRRPIAGGVRLSFSETAEVRARLEAFVAAESECCPFLTMDLHTSDGELVLDVTGPGPAEPIIAELFA